MMNQRPEAGLFLFSFLYILFLYVILGHSPKNSGSNPRSFQFWRYPGLGHFAKLASPKTDGWIRQWQLINPCMIN